MTTAQVNTQAERTALAWNRTLLAFAGVIGVIAMHAAFHNQPAVLVAGIVTVAGALILLSWIASRRVWKRAAAALEGQRSSTSPLALLVLAGACLVVSLIGLLLAVIPEGLPT